MNDGLTTSSLDVGGVDEFPVVFAGSSEKFGFLPLTEMNHLKDLTGWKGIKLMDGVTSGVRVGRGVTFLQNAQIIRCESVNLNFSLV